MATYKTGGLAPLNGAALLTYAKTVIAEIMAKEPAGVNLEESVKIAFSVPTTPAEKQWAKEQFLRAVKSSNKMFKKQVNGWAFIRAGSDGRYHVVVGMDAGNRIVPIAPAGALEEIEPFTSRRLRTQIRSRQQVRSALGQQLVSTGIATGNTAMVARGNNVLDELVILSPRMHLLGADMGELVDVARLAHTITATATVSPRTRMLLLQQAKRIQKTVKRLNKECRQLTDDAVAIQQIFVKGALPPAPLP